MGQRTDGYRQVRVLFYPSAGQTAVAVVARSSTGRTAVDRIVWRGVVDGAPETHTIATLLLACSDVLADAGRRMGH